MYDFVRLTRICHANFPPISFKSTNVLWDMVMVLAIDRAWKRLTNFSTTVSLAPDVMSAWWNITELLGYIVLKFDENVCMVKVLRQMNDMTIMFAIFENHEYGMCNVYRL